MLIVQVLAIQGNKSLFSGQTLCLTDSGHRPRKKRPLFMLINPLVALGYVYLGKNV